MTTQRIQLDISNDIYDKVMFFLENLPKNKSTSIFSKRSLSNSLFFEPDIYSK